MNPQTEVIDLTRQYIAALQELGAARDERQHLIEECKRVNIQPQHLKAFSANTQRLHIANETFAALRAALQALGGAR